jgi:hypothetical protein
LKDAATAFSITCSLVRAASRDVRSRPTPSRVHPLDPSTIGAQASNDQLEKILSYLDIGKQEGEALADNIAVSVASLRQS